MVLVAREPGSWFDDVLSAVAAQDHPHVDVVVMDIGGGESLEDRVAAVLPGTEVVRPEGSTGFGAAASAAAARPHRFGFHLFLSDDAVLDATAVRRMVEVAVEANAGVVGLKLLDGVDAGRLHDMGASVDRYGSTVPRIEPGEIDQGQYDAHRDVFAASSVLLVRADLFAAVGGFDPALAAFDAHVDLCWRARHLGAAVLIAPNAVGRLAAVAERRSRARRRRLDPARCGPRHRIRMSWSNQSSSRAALLTVELLVVTVVGVVYGLVRGRFRHVWALASSWPWNLRHLGSLRARRATLRVHHPGGRLGDPGGGDHPPHAFRRAVTGRAPEGTGPEAPTRARLQTLWGALLGPGGLALLAGAAVMGFGSRHLVTRGLPAIGRFQPLPGDPLDLVRAWWTSWRPTAAGVADPGPDALALLGGLGWWLPFETQVVAAVAVLAAFPLGAIGVWRLVQPVGGGRSRAVAVTLYLAVPTPYHALAEGRFGPLAVYAALPWICRRLAVAHGVVPYGERGGDPGPGTILRSLWADATATGATVAVAMFAEPAVLVPTAIMIVALIVGSLVAGSIAGLWRLVAVTVVATVIAGLIHLPMVLQVVEGRPLSSWFPPDVWPEAQIGAADLLRFDTGPFGIGLLGWTLLIAPAVALAVTAGWRLAITVRAGFCIAGGFGGVWVVDQGFWTAGAPVAEILIAPAAVGLAWAAAAGTATLGEGLAGRSGRWRIAGPSLVVVAIAGAVVPVAMTSMDGRWGLPAEDLAATLPVLIEDDADGPPERVLWIGHPQLLPAVGTMVEGGVAVALTDGYPDVGDQAPVEVSATSALAEVGRSLTGALDGGTSRLGRQLGVWSVGHIVLVERSAPAPHGDVEVPLPAAYAATFTRQLDLIRVEGLNRSVTIYRNTAVEPVHAGVRDRTNRAVPVRITGGSYGEIELLALADGAYRWRLGPAGAWSFVPGEGASDVTEPGPRGEPTVRVASGAVGVLELDDTVGTSRRSLQLAMVLVVLLMTSWSHAGRRTARR